MRIAVWHNLRSGGGKRALYHQVAGLVARGHQLEIWCPPTADASVLPLRDLAPEHVLPLDEPSRAERRSPYRRTTGMLERIDDHCRRCAVEIDRGRFDVLLAHPCVLTRAAPIGRHLRLPKVLYLQEPFRSLYEASPELPWRALSIPRRASLHQIRRYLRDLSKVQGLRVQVREEWRSASAYDGILVSSLFSRESVRRAYGLESRVCRLGIDAALFAPGRAVREPFIVSVGGLDVHKGAERAIDALAAIPSSRRPPLVWIGNYVSERYRGRVAERAVAAGVALRVETAVSDAALVDLLQRASAMLYVPILEPFGLAPLEANACETPVVAIAEGGVRETIEDGVNGFLLPDGDPAALADRLSSLLGDPERARAIGRRARQRVLERWDWAGAVDRLEAHLQAAVRARTA